MSVIIEWQINSNVRPLAFNELSKWLQIFDIWSVNEKLAEIIVFEVVMVPFTVQEKYLNNFLILYLLFELNYKW